MVGVNSGGEIVKDHVHNLFLVSFRIVRGGYAMQINHGKNSLVSFILELYPVFYRPKIITKMQFARGADTGEDVDHRNNNTRKLKNQPDYLFICRWCISGMP